MSSPDTPSPSSAFFSRRNFGIAALVLATSAAGAWFLVGRPAAEVGKPQAENLENRPVLVQKVQFATAAPARILVGTVRARVETDQGFRISGKVAERRVQAGDRVKKGQVVATLDPADLTLQRETAEAELAAAKASEKSSSAELMRVIELRAKGWSTEQALDRQRAALEEATGRRLRAERQLELARNAQSYAELLAEDDGIVVSTSVEPGQVLAAGQPVLRIAKDGLREALVAIPEQEMDDIRKALAEASLWTDPGRSYPAKLRELSPAADPLTRTFQARFTLEGLPADAPLGMSASLSVRPAEELRVARLPLAAILNEGKGTEVFVVEASGELKRKAVQISAYEARDALVSSGLADGDLVVVLGVHKLKPGLKVRPVTEMRLG
ncbi:MAG: efflux RND transporter periplasmic adaptor subunit [Methylobacterium sp.]|nr:efflux RND transporter periplasmic adaptor subunit [Methylobacterium sp.]MCA3655808.1 efflux RND transporter periplasmic adaptor subunit [Methylobacterium sp.]MCA3659582.1 efflux RND transporter periplasmic adaptor subunit [Methylobacterium sp.]MCA3662210.1 efflux RND transporter periplasmic adaptor subunit [Methylobacterium sp.]MCA3663803.1 efflux RND transporter periplasmic adaptor subunit [Methylobacterium sp.]